MHSLVVTSTVVLPMLQLLLFFLPCQLELLVCQSQATLLVQLH